MLSSFIRRSSRQRGGFPLIAAAAGAPATPTLGALSFAGATDWFAGTHAGTHHEVWAGNTSRDTLTMGYAPKMPIGWTSKNHLGFPQSIYDVDRNVVIHTYSAWNGSQVIMGVCEIACATGTRTYTQVENLGATGEDHYAAIIVKRPDNKYIWMWGFHGYDANLHWRISTNANDTTAWGAEKTKAMTQTPDYVNAIRLAGDGGRWVITFRAGTGSDMKYYYAVSTDNLDNAANLSAGTVLVTQEAGAARGIYGTVYPDPDNTDRIWFAMSQYDVVTPQSFKDVAVFYAEFASGAPTCYAPDGTSLGSDIAWAEFTTGNLSLVYDGDAVGADDTWVLDLVVKDGVTYCVYQVMDTVAAGTNYDYAIAVLDLTGTPTLTTRTLWDHTGDGTNGTVAENADSRPSGGQARLCPWNPLKAWLCAGVATAAANASTRHKLRAYTTADAWATKSAATVNFTQSTRHNFKPICPWPTDSATAPPATYEVAWHAGYYNSYHAAQSVLVTGDWNGAVIAFDFNEPSGTPANKLVGASILGTAAKLSTPDMGATGVNNGKALSLLRAGAPEGMNLGYQSLTNVQLPAAYLGWVNLDDTAADTIFGAYGGSGTHQWAGVISASGKAGLGVGTAETTSGLTGFTTGAWQHWGILTDTSGGNPRWRFHLDGVIKHTHGAGFTHPAVNFYWGCRNNTGTADVGANGDICQFIEDWGADRDAAWLLAVAGYASAGTFTSANKTAVVTNGPVVGPTITPSATLPTGASYNIKLISTSTPAGQTKTGTASTPIVFDAVEIADGDTVSIVVTPATSDKTVAPSFTSFSIAA